MATTTIETRGDRRSFLQSVIALPLIVTGEPRITLGVSVPVPYRVGGRQSEIEMRPRPEIFDRETGISMRFIKSWDLVKVWDGRV